jgi:hypothetical protein
MVPGAGTENGVRYHFSAGYISPLVGARTMQESASKKKGDGIAVRCAVEGLCRREVLLS